MSKIIVTHLNPDLDAMMAIWLLRKFGDEEFKEAEIKFVAAGETFRGAPVDNDEEVVHVDTGLGKFDHHQTDEKTCAAMLVFEELKKKRQDLGKNKALIRVLKFINQTDHFGAYFWPEPTNDRYIFMLELVLNGFKLGGHGDDQALMRLGLVCLDGAYSMMKILVEAEKELAKGMEFKTRWGKALAILTSNDVVMKLGQKKGFKVVARKDPDLGNVRIKAAPEGEIDLTPVYEEIRKRDRQGTWFFHSSKRMLLNGSSKNPGQKPSSLSLKEVRQILERV